MNTYESNYLQNKGDFNITINGHNVTLLSEIVVNRSPVLKMMYERKSENDEVADNVISSLVTRECVDEVMKALYLGTYVDTADYDLQTLFGMYLLIDWMQFDEYDNVGFRVCLGIISHINEWKKLSVANMQLFKYNDCSDVCETMTRTLKANAEYFAAMEVKWMTSDVYQDIVGLKIVRQYRGILQMMCSYTRDEMLEIIEEIIDLDDYFAKMMMKKYSVTK